MFHQVRIFDRKGNTKKVLSSKFLSKRYWHSFFESTNKIGAPKKSQSRMGNKAGNKDKPCEDNPYFFED